MKTSSLLLVAVLGAGADRPAAAPAVTVRQILSTDTTTSGLPIAPPAAGTRVVVSMYDIAPGAALPVHKHPASRFGYVLAGSLSVENVETGSATIFRKGDFIVEDVDRWHRARQIGPEAVRLLVIDHARPGTSNVIRQVP